MKLADATSWSARYADIVATTRTPAPRWLDAEEMQAWIGYIDSLSKLQALLEADLAPHGLTMGDYEVLVRLSESDDQRLRMCDLARDLRLSPSGMTRRLDGLVRGGLVRREPSEQDRRVMLATLTPRGLDVLTKAAPDHVAAVRRHFLDHLDRNDIQAIGTVFAKVRQGLEAQCPTACP
jgi:DNA-binding MarR family transcriptional regulator